MAPSIAFPFDEVTDRSARKLDSQNKRSFGGLKQAQTDSVARPRRRCARPGLVLAAIEQTLELNRRSLAEGSAQQEQKLR